MKGRIPGAITVGSLAGLGDRARYPGRAEIGGDSGRRGTLPGEIVLII